MSRIVAFDYGERRIGVAVSDPTRTIAAPLATLRRRAGKRPPWAEIVRLLDEQEAGMVVLGLPLRMSGEESDWTRQVRGFGVELERRTGIPVRWQDERLTSVEAERAIRGMGLSKTRREEKDRVDATAAALILRGFLDQHESGSPEERG